MSEQADDGFDTDPSQVIIAKVFTDSEEIFQECAAIIRNQLPIEGLEPQEDDQPLISEPVIIPNPCFTFITEGEIPITPDTLRVSFELVELIKYPRVHIFGKWLTSRAPFLSKEAFIQASPKEYTSAKIRIWFGNDDMDAEPRKVIGLSKDRTSDLYYAPQSEIKTQAAHEATEDIETIRQLLQLVQAETPK